MLTSDVGVLVYLPELLIYGTSELFAFVATGFGGFFQPFITRGDLASVILFLEEVGLLFPNIGLPAQTSANACIGNYASSNYNALLTTLRNRFSNGLQFDFNYTYSHSIDNVSDVANTYVEHSLSGNGLVCELDNPRTWRASSDFDGRRTFNVNHIYDLPVGQGRHFLHNAPRWLNAIVSGWGTSSIITWRTGYPFTVRTGSFPTTFTLDAPAVPVNAAGLKQNIHTDPAGELQYFSSQSSAVAAFAFPFGGGTGTRNAVRGPWFLFRRHGHREIQPMAAARNLRWGEATAARGDGDLAAGVGVGVERYGEIQGRL